MAERGATVDEVEMTVRAGERFAAKLDRTGFRRNFPYNGSWKGTPYANKQVEAIAVMENNAWLVLTIITKYF